MKTSAIELSCSIHETLKVTTAFRFLQFKHGMAAGGNIKPDDLCKDIQGLHRTWIFSTVDAVSILNMSMTRNFSSRSRDSHYVMTNAAYLHHQTHTAGKHHFNPHRVSFVKV